MEQSQIDKLMAGGAAKAPAPAQPHAQAPAAQGHPTPNLYELPAGAARSNGSSLDTLLDVSLPVAIEFGRTSMTVQEVLELGAGSVIQLDRMVGEPIDIYVGDRRLAEGEVVVIGEHFGVRITRILSGADAALAG
jgi:flagellar motor switch protein FliN/FliY